MSSLILPLRVRSTHICQSCRHRSLSTTARRLAIEPESPRYIDIPEPPQQAKADQVVVKGILPVPRNIVRRTSKSSVEQATKDPQTPRSLPTDPSLAFKVAQAGLRKYNLAAGYAALSSRSAQRTIQNRERSKRNCERREELLAAPEHDSDRFTAITLDPSVRAELERFRSGGGAPDPGRTKRYESAVARLAVREKRSKAARQDALHTLYMNARTFIVDEAGLNKAIDTAFGTEQEPYEFRGGKPSLWGMGSPPRLQDMVVRQGGAGREQMEGGRSQARDQLLKERIMRMAEAITGGKMD